MDPIRRSLVAAATLSALGLRLPAHAQNAPPAPVKGRDYTVLDPALPVETPGKIEVLEFFWYGCIHCFNFEPMVEAWLKKKPADVEFRRIPAVFNDRWAHDARIYYAFEALGLVEKLHAPLFESIHRARLNTAAEQPFTEWLTKQGVDHAKFHEAFKSFGVQSKIRRAVQLTTAYRIDGTPAIAVNGTYTISVDQAKSMGGMLRIADHLAGEIRKNPPAKK
jgi:thiol:disulfide interchange protein DsbA